MANCREKAESATRDSDTEAEKQLAGGLRGHVTGDKVPFTTGFIFCRNPGHIARNGLGLRRIGFEIVGHSVSSPTPTSELLIGFGEEKA